jgi:hypothetical protein
MDDEEEVKEGEEPTSLPDDDLEAGIGDDVLLDDEGEYDPDNNYS